MKFRGSVTMLQPHPSCPVNNNQTAVLQGITTLTALFFPPSFWLGNL